MKALVLQSNGVLEYTDVADPVIRNDECLVSVHTAGICNSDIFRAFQSGAYHYPLVMGHEFSGKISSVGSMVKEFSVGQGVVAFPLLPCFKCEACANEKWVHCGSYDYYGSRRDGAFAEYIAVKAWNLMKVPQNCDLGFAFLAEPLAVAVHTVKKISEKKKGRLLVLGGGFIGISVAKLAEERGLFDQIWIFDRNKFKLEVAERAGIRALLMDGGMDSKFEKYFDVVIEACGAAETFRDSIHYCKDQAQLIWMGNIQKELVLSKSDVSMILRKEIVLNGVWNSDYRSASCDWTDALDIIGRAFWIKELVTHRVKLSEGRDILADMHKVKANGLPHSYLKTSICL